MADDNLNVKVLWWIAQPVKRITEATKMPCFYDGDVVTFGHSLVFFSTLKFRYKNGHFYVWVFCQMYGKSSVYC